MNKKQIALRLWYKGKQPVTDISKEFGARFKGWKDYVKAHPMLKLMSNPRAFTNNEPYKKIIAIGKPALPEIMQKLEKGEFLLNQAALQILDVQVKDLPGISDRAPFPSEQEISKGILTLYKSMTHEEQPPVSTPPERVEHQLRTEKTLRRESLHEGRKHKA